MKRIKKTLTISAFTFLFLLFACHKDNEPASDPMHGTIVDPAWSVSSDYDYSNSMTAVANVLLLQHDGNPVAGDIWTLDTADRLAAFVGNECVGVAKPNGNLFFLFIVSTHNTDVDEPVSLRYYSAKLLNIFHTDTTFPFVNGSQQGTASAPLQVLFRP